MYWSICACMGFEWYCCWAELEQYTDLKWPWLLVKTPDGCVEFTHQYVGISWIVLASFVENVEMHFYPWSVGINCILWLYMVNNIHLGVPSLFYIPSGRCCLLWFDCLVPFIADITRPRPLSNIHHHPSSIIWMKIIPLHWHPLASILQ